jgi:hypothetical protein
MWKVKLDDDVWLAEAGTTTNESEAYYLIYPQYTCNLKKCVDVCRILMR